MKLAKLFRFVLILCLILFTISRKRVNEEKVKEKINKLIGMYTEGKPFNEIDIFQDKLYKLIQNGDENDKKAALKEIEDKDENYLTYEFYQRIEKINYTNLNGTLQDFTGDLYDFDTINIKDFKQSADGSACVLYSALYAISQNAVLKNDLKSIVKVSDSNIVVKLGSSSYFKVPKDYAEKQKGTELHPSKNIVLVAIGESILFNLKSSGLGDITNYAIVNNGKDVIWGRDIVEIDHSNLDKIEFASDGSLVVKSTQQATYTGNFVVSIGTTNGGGHAISAFFRKGSWVLFDNMIGELAITDLKNYKVISMYLIGNVEKRRKRKNIKRKLK